MQSAAAAAAAAAVTLTAAPQHVQDVDWMQSVSGGMVLHQQGLIPSTLQQHS